MSGTIFLRSKSSRLYLPEILLDAGGTSSVHGNGNENFNI
jgi:hypothetical protein